MPDPMLGDPALSMMYRSKATSDGVYQTLPDGTEIFWPAESLEGWLEAKTEPTYSYFRPSRWQRIRREIVRRFHIAMAWIHDRFFSRYCCCSW